MANLKISHERFVELWMLARQIGESYKWLEEETGLTLQAIYAKARRLRVAGVKLPVIGKNGNQTDIKGLNAMIEGAMKGESDGNKNALESDS